MTAALEWAPDRARLTAASTLQKLLPRVAALSLDAKQAHWNVTGPQFLPLHALTDEIAAFARGWADRLAERAVALGFDADARPATVAAAAEQFPAGRLTDQEATTELARSLTRVADATHSSLDTLADADAVAHDLVVSMLEGIEKYRWMLLAQGS